MVDYRKGNIENNVFGSILHDSLKKQAGKCQVYWENSELHGELGGLCLSLGHQEEDLWLGAKFIGLMSEEKVCT